MNYVINDLSISKAGLIGLIRSVLFFK